MPKETQTRQRHITKCGRKKTWTKQEDRYKETLEDKVINLEKQDNYTHEN